MFSEQHFCNSFKERDTLSNVSEVSKEIFNMTLLLKIAIKIKKYPKLIVFASIVVTQVTDLTLHD